MPTEDDDVVDMPLLSTKLIESQLSPVAKLAERAAQWHHALAASTLVPGPALMPTPIITHVPSTPGKTPLVSSPGRAPVSVPASRVPPPLRGEATVHVQRASDGAVDGAEVHLRIENGGHEPCSVRRIAYTEVLDDDGAPMAAGRRTILATNEVCASTSLSRAARHRTSHTYLPTTPSSQVRLEPVAVLRGGGFLLYTELLPMASTEVEPPCFFISDVEYD